MGGERDDADLSPAAIRDVLALVNELGHAQADDLNDSDLSSRHAERIAVYYNAVVAGPARRALDITLSFCETASDDDDLCWIGVNLVEPLLDLHWKAVHDRFEKAAISSANVRKALSCATLDIRPRGKRKGALVEHRLRDLIGPNENIGGST